MTLRDMTHSLIDDLHLVSQAEMVYNHVLRVARNQWDDDEVPSSGYRTCPYTLPEIDQCVRSLV